MKNAIFPGGNRCCRLRGIHTASGRFAANEFNFFIRYKIVKHPHRIASAADTGKHRIRQLALCLQNLFPCFFADDTLKVAHHHGIRVRSHNRTYYIGGVVHTGGPVPHGFINRILQCACSCRDRMYLCTQQLHAVNIQRLPFGIFHAHKDFAFHVKQCRSGCSRNAVLARASLCNNACFSHFFCKQCLPKHVIDFMGARMVQILALKVNFRTAEVFCHFLCIIKQGRTVCIITEKVMQFFPELRVFFIIFVGVFQPVQLMHQRFRNILPAEFAISSFSHFVSS